MTPPAELKSLLAEAFALEKRGDLDAAERRFADILRAHPQSGEVLHAFGIHRLQRGDVTGAAHAIARAVVIKPNEALYQRDLGELFRRLGQFEQSIACGVAATRLAPKDADAFYNLGLAHADLGNEKKAIECYRRATRLAPLHGMAFNNLGTALEHSGDISGAEKAYREAVKIDARRAEAQNNLGALLLKANKLDEARHHLGAAIDARAGFIEAHYNLSTLKTYRRDDPHLIELLALAGARETLAPKAHIEYAFALGKALEDAGENDGAFAAFAEGNALQHALTPFDVALAKAHFDAVRETFTAAFFEKRSHWSGHVDARTPIFIVGMPRSGTSLIEQILATHPQVFGAGELPDLDCVIRDTLDAKLDRASAMERLSERDLQAIGKRYLDRAFAHSPKSQFVTDKMPANFFHLGLIRLALPHAKIIHALRDPMDTCWSCFTRHFESSMEFTYELCTIARYFERYAKMMDHWSRVLPKAWILESRYEEIVSDTENKARELTDFLGLPWDPGCLAFYDNPRHVATASVAQVRRPIYATSIGRWQRFARHLGPLFDVVRPYRGSDDLDVATLAALAQSSASPDAAENARHAERLCSEGLALYRQGLRREALARYEEALSLRPGLEAALNGRGFVLQELGELEAARASFDACVQLAPGNAMARLNLAMVQLKLGQFDIGWENYEARWSGSAESMAGTLNRAVSPLAQWNGEANTEALRLLVITEQGFGDTFQFARYLALLGQRFREVGFACSQPTLRLMEWSFGERIAITDRLPSQLEDWDLQCPLLSLPRAFKTRPDSIPAEVPYLKVAAPARRFWQRRLERNASRALRVGIAWAGRRAHQYDARRSMGFELLTPLFENTAISWVSLQKWANNDIRPAPPEGIEWFDWTGEFADFADTAALVANLDLVISIDSALVHLAGGLGVAVWLLNRFDGEWRWLHQREDSPWYPTVRIFTQPALGDWTSVIHRVSHALKEYPAPRREKARSQRTQLAEPKASAKTPAVDLAQAVEMAARHQSAGRLHEAEALLREVIAREPQNAHALHLLGVIAHQLQRPAEAIGWVTQAIAKNGSVALYHANLTEMLRQDGQLDQAIAAGETAIALDSALALAHANLGIAYYDAERFEDAEAAEKRALELEPRLIQAMNTLGSIERKRERRQSAAEWYRRALAVAPTHLESLSNLGAVLLEDQRNEEAIAPLERALAIAPEFAEALCNLGLAHYGAARFLEAEGFLSRALQLRPRHVESVVGLARVLIDTDRLEAGHALLDDAIKSGLSSPDLLFLYASVLAQLGATENAEAAFARALALRAEFPEALVGLGNLRLEAGESDAAVALFEQALAIEPDHVGASFHLLFAQRVEQGSAALVRLKTLISSGRLPPADLMSAHYGVGKGLDDLGEYADAFGHYLAGAAIKRGMIQYDAAWEEARTRRIAEVIDAKFLDRLKGAGNASRQPIFILGMPRSGTTLTEQIIASHSQVFGAGELPALMEIVQRSLEPGEEPIYPENLSALTRDTLDAWASDYLARLPPSGRGFARVTDKMPANYFALGLIALMLPNAKIIHVMRDPLDTCVSCFTRLFGRSHAATYDLAEVGRLYVSYAELMDHWRALLPGRFLDVRYEDIVADIDHQARRLIDYCDLPWEDKCLAFHKTRRNIRTSSVTQVREPLYTRSVERWRHYEAYLEPLVEALGKYAQRR